MIQQAVSDAEARQSSAAANFAASTKLGVRGSGSTNQRYAYLYFGKAPFPAGATVLAATLRVYLAGAWAGTNDLTASRITTKWAETTLKWNLKPTVTATNAATETVTGGADGDVVEFDVTAMLNDVANGGACFGVRIALTQDAARLLYASEWSDADLRPELEVTWSEAPEPSDRLAPDANLQVSTSDPILSWQFNDDAGDTSQTSIRIQANKTDDDFSSPDFDTGKIAWADRGYDLSADATWAAGAGAADGETWYWRIMVWDGTDLASDWSASAVFGRTNLGSLALDNPGATVPETTPPIAWTLTGATQERYQATLYRIEDSGKLTQLWQEKATNAATTSVTPSAGLIKTGPTYRVVVEVWDDVDRYGDDHLTVEQDFTYVRDGSPDPILTLTAVQYVAPDGTPTPAVVLTFTRTDAADYFALVVDGEEVLDRIPYADVHTTGTTHQLVYWGLTPRQAHTITIEAVVIDGTSQAVHSDAGGLSVSVNYSPTAIWLVDDSDPGTLPGDFVAIYGREAADLAIGETGTTYDLIGAQAPVRITDVIRGYEGAIAGSLLGLAGKEAFLTLKAKDADLRLVVGDLSIPVRLEEAHVSPTPDPGDEEHMVGFTVFQVGEPWPVPR